MRIGPPFSERGIEYIYVYVGKHRIRIRLDSLNIQTWLMVAFVGVLLYGLGVELVDYLKTLGVF